MANIKQVYGAISPAINFGTALSGLANGSDSLSDAVDNSTNAYLAMDLELSFSWAGADTGTADIYLAASADGGTTYADETVLSNLLFIGSVTANGTTATEKVIRVEQLPQHFKIHVVNNGGTGALAASTVKYSGLYLSNA